MPALVILAAGAARRFGGGKQLAAVGPGGACLMDYTIHDAVRAGFSAVVCVVDEASRATCRDHLVHHWSGRVDLRFAVQRISDVPVGAPDAAKRTKPWGTAHAVLAARKAVSEPLAVVNADDFYSAEAIAHLANFLRGVDASDATHAVVPYLLGETLVENASANRALLTVDKDGFLLGIDERVGIGRTKAAIKSDHVELSADTLVSMNAWAFTPVVFDQLESLFIRFLANGPDADAEFYLPAAIRELIARQEATVRVLPTGHGWFGMTRREDLEHVRARLRALIDAGTCPEELGR